MLDVKGCQLKLHKPLSRIPQVLRYMSLQIRCNFPRATYQGFEESMPRGVAAVLPTKGVPSREHVGGLTDLADLRFLHVSYAARRK